MKNIRSHVSPLITLALLAVAPGWAHHGSSGFDGNRPVHLTGKISVVDWTNPHVVIHLKAAGADGNPVEWLVNTLPPNAAARQGFPKNAFAPGTELTIDGYRAEDGSNHLNASAIVFADGRKIATPGCFDASGKGLPWGSKDCVAPAAR